MSYDIRHDDYELERSHDLERRLDRNEEQEPYWRHDRPRSTKRRPRYFSRLMFRPVSQPRGDVAEKGLAS